MRFQVPQFIEVEDKIFGPLTLKQFLYLLGGAGLSFLIYTFIKNIVIDAILIVPILGFVLALAFYKINNKPFINVVEAAFTYYVGNKLYIWKKIDKPIVAKKAVAPATSGNLDFYVPKLSDSKLKDLTWSLDIKQSQNPAQSQGGKSNI
ncbi:MAG TPA: PrgI family protein [Thermodesulfobacteriota bacterium]|nr:PrgI family protein [Candidatus Paceibacterota bacterium]HVY56177.1 PrgI family protein [Thermodesulfobacteriota bacterium]